MLFTFMILLMEQLYFCNVITLSILVRKCPIEFWILFKQKKLVYVLIHYQNGVTLITFDFKHYILLMVQLFLSYIKCFSVIYLFVAQQKKKFNNVDY